ncbi:DUF1826 domain-containing protein (plasmid) [Skermanella sp. TT6]|uniref:DUF1826 domain-containing protein n=1 Tax=Skermanella cutis TaxID=2775420 RepID=A0ABX7BF39_9PROT|nr:DUF1826 domain-containing protein [Skermanella sp. TT6]QQP93014.1 DUF1826 domain-containing protein [Skermanella sp. TT6]
MPRSLEAFIAEALDAAPAASLPRIHFAGTVRELRTELCQALDLHGFGPPWLSDWLAEDVHFLARMFEDLLGSGRMLVRLQAGADEGCRRFHAGDVRFRLVTAYRGPGLQWVEPRALAHLAPEEVLPTSAIRQLDRGWVAMMRGGSGATAEHPGLLHRSPPIAETGITPLVLTMDDAMSRGMA